MKAYNLETALKHREEVTELSLHNCRLDHLPPVVFGMPRLWKLEVSVNRIGEMPRQIGQLKNLRSLSLSFNQLTELPPRFFELRQLTELNLSNNQIKSLPPAIGRLQNLQRLRLAGNALEALPPEIGQLKQLTHLDIQQNQIKRLPPQLGELAKLRQLQAAHNRIGRLPKALFQLTSLDLLDLSHNRLRTLPAAIGQLRMLTELNLGSNLLETIPESIAELLVLRRLLLSKNKIAAFPVAISRLPWLSNLSLEKNKITELPENIGLCRRLETLTLSHNQLSELPVSMANLDALSHLYLDGNRLDSLPPLPSRIKWLSIRNNQFAELPPSIQNLDNLQVLNAEKNQLSGLPEGFRQLYQLQRLWLDGNPMPDLPKPLFFLSALESLKGPGDADARRKLMRFLKLCRSREVPGRLRLAIYDVMEEGGRRLGEFPATLLLDALSIGMSDVAYAIRKQLLEERYGAQDISRPCEGKRVYLMGETGFEPERLRPQLEKLGMQLIENPEQEVDYLVLGRLLRSMQAKAPAGYQHLISRYSLSSFLSRELGHTFALDPTPQQLSNLRLMIFSPERAQRSLALQLLKTNGAPKQLLTDLFLAWKLGYGEQHTLERLLLQNTSEEALRAMYYPLGLTGRTSEATLTTHIIKYTEGNEFDGIRIAQFLNELYGTARFYLRQYG